MPGQLTLTRRGAAWAAAAVLAFAIPFALDALTGADAAPAPAAVVEPAALADRPHRRRCAAWPRCPAPPRPERRARAAHRARRQAGTGGPDGAGAGAGRHRGARPARPPPLRLRRRPPRASTRPDDHDPCRPPADRHDAPVARGRAGPLGTCTRPAAARGAAARRHGGDASPARRAQCSPAWRHSRSRPSGRLVARRCHGRTRARRRGAADRGRRRHAARAPGRVGACPARVRRGRGRAPATFAPAPGLPGARCLLAGRAGRRLADPRGPAPQLPGCSRHRAARGSPGCRHGRTARSATTSADRGDGRADHRGRARRGRARRHRRPGAPSSAARPASAAIASPARIALTPAPDLAFRQRAAAAVRTLDGQRVAGRAALAGGRRLRGRAPRPGTPRGGRRARPVRRPRRHRRTVARAPRAPRPPTTRSQASGAVRFIARPHRSGPRRGALAGALKRLR